MAKPYASLDGPGALSEPPGPPLSLREPPESPLLASGTPPEPPGPLRGLWGLALDLLDPSPDVLDPLRQISGPSVSDFRIPSVWISGFLDYLGHLGHPQRPRTPPRDIRDPPRRSGKSTCTSRLSSSLPPSRPKASDLRGHMIAPRRISSLVPSSSRDLPPSGRISSCILQADSPSDVFLPHPVSSLNLTLPLVVDHPRFHLLLESVIFLPPLQCPAMFRSLTLDIPGMLTFHLSGNPPRLGSSILSHLLDQP